MTKYTITTEMHEKIHRVYRTGSGNGQIVALARSLSLPRWKISRYAIQNGWIAKGKREPAWNQKELKILEKYAHLHPERIQLKLKAKGFNRTATGIVLKRKRLHLLQNMDIQLMSWQSF